MKKQIVLTDYGNKFYGGKCAPSADKVEDFVGCSVRCSFGGEVALMINEGTPKAHCIAKVCNKEWAGRIANALNAPNKEMTGKEQG